MDPFPEDWELLSLFEVEPVLADRGVPWFYNCLKFETIRGDDHVCCEIEPASQVIRLSWCQARCQRLSLELHWVSGLKVVTGNGRDYFIATFRDPNLLDMEFHLKPEIRAKWGTSCECP